MQIPPQTILRCFQTEFDVKETGTNGEYRINSIFTQDKKYKLYFNIYKQVYICFKTGNNGSIIQLFSIYFDIDEKDVIQYILNNYGVGLVQEEQKKEEVIDNTESLKELQNVVWFKEECGIYGKRAIHYLHTRKVPQKYINQWGYICNKDSEFDQRIIIPFFEDEKIVFFQGRDIEGKSKIKYKNATIGSKDYLFNYDEINSNMPLCLVEGVMDAVSISNIPATSIMSANLSQKQIQKIVEKGVREIIFIPDQDKTGMDTLQNNIDLLYYYYPPSLNLKVYIYTILGGYKDFNEYKIKTGIDFIKIEDCKIYKKNIFKGFKSEFSEKLIV